MGKAGNRRRSLLASPATTRWVGELAWFVLPLALCPVVALLRPGSERVAMERAELLLGWERAIGVAIEPSVHAWFSARAPLSAAATAVYLGAHLSAVIGTACWLAVRHRAAYLRFRTTFAVAQVLTVVMYLVAPVAPLRILLDGESATAGGSWSRSIQYEFAAMPSGHVVFALVVAIRDLATCAVRLAMARDRAPGRHPRRDRRDGEPPPGRRGGRRAGGRRGDVRCEVDERRHGVGDAHGSRIGGGRTGGVNVAADVVVPACAWSAWNLIVALGTSQAPSGWFRRRGGMPPSTSRARRCERRLRPWHVRRWKRHLPDAGAALPGVAPMRRLARIEGHGSGRDAVGTRHSALERYATDARRSEVVHWMSLVGILPCFALWPAVVIGPMSLMAVLINVPCLIALRDTRARIDRLLVIMGERGPR